MCYRLKNHLDSIITPSLLRICRTFSNTPKVHNKPRKKTESASVLKPYQTKEGLQELIQFQSESKQLFGPLLNAKNKRKMTPDELHALNEKIDFFAMEVENKKERSSPQIADNLSDFHEKINKAKQAQKANTIMDQNVELHPRERKTIKCNTIKPILVDYPLNGNGVNTDSSTLMEYIKSLDKLPSVVRILQDTMSAKSRANLERWKKQKIKELGEEGFEKYKQDLFHRGTNLHACIADQLTTGSVTELLPANEGMWSSLLPVFPDIEQVELVEATVTHPQLGYTGKLDAVVRYRGDLVLVDWKTADRKKSTLDATYDDPLQILAYIGALNADPSLQQQVSHGLLVVAYRDGSEADVLDIPYVLCDMYWKQWLARLQKYWNMRLTK